MLKEVVDFLITSSKFSTPTCFGTWLPSSGGRVCLINHPSKVLCCGRVRVMTRPVWPVLVTSSRGQFSWNVSESDSDTQDVNHLPKHVGVENLERINKKSTSSLNICWSYCKR
jgi:hypothetical protein